ncbi:MAG: hypothetical protein OXC05_11005 [Halieaceae bacterium]|nr:hypothetical protein [Halieaceae bacterium]
MTVSAVILSFAVQRVDTRIDKAGELINNRIVNAAGLQAKFLWDREGQATEAASGSEG